MSILNHGRKHLIICNIFTIVYFINNNLCIISYTVIKALTNYEVADDWDFSEELGRNQLIMAS